MYKEVRFRTYVLLLAALPPLLLSAPLLPTLPLPASQLVAEQWLTFDSEPNNGSAICRYQLSDTKAAQYQYEQNYKKVKLLFSLPSFSFSLLLRSRIGALIK